MANPEPDCNCKEFLEIMGMTWYECMYAVMCKTALEINQKLMRSNDKIKELEDHIDILNQIKENNEFS